MVDLGQHCHNIPGQSHWELTHRQNLELYEKYYAENGMKICGVKEFIIAMWTSIRNYLKSVQNDAGEDAEKHILNFQSANYGLTETILSGSDDTRVISGSFETAPDYHICFHSHSPEKTFPTLRGRPVFKLD